MQNKFLRKFLQTVALTFEPCVSNRFKTYSFRYRRGSVFPHLFFVEPSNLFFEVCLFSRKERQESFLK